MVYGFSEREMRDGGTWWVSVWRIRRREKALEGFKMTKRDGREEIAKFI